MAFTSSVCKILKCDGNIVMLVGKKNTAATPYQVAYGYLLDALGKQTNLAAQFGESVKVWDSGEEAAAVAYGVYLVDAFAYLALNNPDAGWINNLMKDVNYFTDTYLAASL